MSAVASQGTLALLDDPAARELLGSTIPARLAYMWHDGTPRVVPFWFHWTVEEVVLGTPATAPKIAALRECPQAAMTIDSNGRPQGAADPGHGPDRDGAGRRTRVRRRATLSG